MSYSPLILGCTAGPSVIALSYRISYVALAVGVLLAVSCSIIEARRRSFRWLPLYAIAVALQPGWRLLSREEVWEGVMYPRGDCGYENRSMSMFFLSTAVALVVIVWRRRALTRRAFVFRVVSAFTLLNVIDLVYTLSPFGSVISESGSIWLDELYASIFTGIGSGPRHTLVLLCAILYGVQRLPIPRRAGDAERAAA